MFAYVIYLSIYVFSAKGLARSNARNKSLHNTTTHASSLHNTTMTLLYICYYIYTTIYMRPHTALYHVGVLILPDTSLYCRMRAHMCSSLGCPHTACYHIICVLSYVSLYCLLPLHHSAYMASYCVLYNFTYVWPAYVAAN